MRTVLKRAKYFITVKGKYYGNVSLEPEAIKEELRSIEAQKQMSIFDFL
jgi:predicted DNA-binding helix-hairpin-helix protein